MIALMTSCASGKIVLSNNANISKYKYVIFGKETTDRFFKIDFEELKRLYPDVEKSSDISISERIIGFGKYKGKKFSEIKDDISYLKWLVSIGKISNDDFNSLTTI